MQDSLFSTIKFKLYLVSAWLQLIGTTLISSHTWLLAADFSSPGFLGWPSWVIKPLIQYKASGIELWILGLGVFTYIVGFFGQKIRSPKDWRLIQYILDKAQAIAYSDNSADPKHYHRVTLFRYQKWAHVDHWSKCKLPAWKRKCWPWGIYKPWSGWLVPVRRSCHTSKESRTKFLALLNGTSEGICGLAWSTDGVKIAQDLVEIKTGNPKNRVKYADTTNCPKEMIHHMLDGTVEGKTAPMSIGALPVKVNGDIWGVLVFDSQAPKGVKDTIASDFQITVGAIEQILEKEK